MEDLKIFIWFISILGAWMASYFTIKFQGKNNTERITKLEEKQNINDKKIEEIKLKCKEAISSKEAYSSFVSKEMLELHLKTIEQKIDNLGEIIKGVKK